LLLVCCNFAQYGAAPVACTPDLVGDKQSLNMNYRIFCLTPRCNSIIWHACRILRQAGLRTGYRFLTVLWLRSRRWPRVRAIAASPSCVLPWACTRALRTGLMMVLEQHRLVVKNPDTGRYKLGLRLYELGSRAIDGLDLRGRARPYLDRLQDRFGRNGVLLQFSMKGKSFTWKKWSRNAVYARPALWEAVPRRIVRRSVRPCFRSFRRLRLTRLCGDRA